MSKTKKSVFESLKGYVLAAMSASLLLTTAHSFAGPGKPGENELAPGGNIVEVAIAANDALGVFNTVLTAAQCDYFEGAVVDILTGEDKVTLFAPTDSAFAALDLDASNVCSTFEGNPNALLTILAYHVTEGRRFSNSVFNGQGNTKQIEMLLGSGYISTVDGMIYGTSNTDAIGIVGDFFDINATNGVIHVIDTVLLP